MPALARSFDRHAALDILIRPDRVAERTTHHRAPATIEIESGATQHRTSKVKFTVVISGQRRFRPRTGLSWSDHGTYHFHAVFSRRGKNASIRGVPLPSRERHTVSPTTRIELPRPNFPSPSTPVTSIIQALCQVCTFPRFRALRAVRIPSPHGILSTTDGIRAAHGTAGGYRADCVMWSP